MASYPAEMQNALDALTALPGIGPRSAQRIIFHLLHNSRAETDKLIRSLGELKSRVKFCTNCGNLTTSDSCQICRDQQRDHRLICVVEEPKDVVALEASGSYRGVYHVLMGKIIPLDELGPDELRIKELIARIKKIMPHEVILATGSDIDGETTALYLARALRKFKIKITRIAAGIPVGSSLDFMDPATLTKAISGRQEY